MTVRVLTGKAVGGTIIEATDRDITLYVRAAGSDSNDGLTVGTALATVQAAIDKIPINVSHACVVDVGEGSFVGFAADSYSFSIDGSLLISGALGAPTLTTGTTTGTATGGSASQLIDSGQTWTTNELRGMLVLVDGEYRVAYKNNGTTIDFAGPYGGSVSGKAYSILEQKTELTGTPGFGYGPVNIANTRGSSNSDLIIENFITTTGTIGMWASRCECGTIQNCRVDDAYYGMMIGYCVGGFKVAECHVQGCTDVGIWFNLCYGVFNAQNLFAYDNGPAGIRVESVPAFDGNYLYASSNSGCGLQIFSSNAADCDGGIFENNGTYGIEVDTIGDGSNQWALSYLNALGPISLANNTSGGLVVDLRGIATVSALTGSGNGGYGIEVRSGGLVRISSATAVTGSSGNATINGGTTALTYATHFGSNGDIAINSDNGTMMERKD
jgi:hypothetical protein